MRKRWAPSPRTTIAYASNFTYLLLYLPVINKNVTSYCFSLSGKYSTDLFTEEAVNVIRQHNKSQPLFLFLSHLAVHSGNPNAPLQAPSEVVAKFSYIKDKKRRTFAGEQYVHILVIWKSALLISLMFLSINNFRNCDCCLRILFKNLSWGLVHEGV